MYSRKKKHIKKSTVILKGQSLCGDSTPQHRKYKITSLTGLKFLECFQFQLKMKSQIKMLKENLKTT